MSWDGEWQVEGSAWGPEPRAEGPTAQPTNPNIVFNIKRLGGRRIYAQTGAPRPMPRRGAASGSSLSGFS